jgi:hypothetical protein
MTVEKPPPAKRPPGRMAAPSAGKAVPLGWRLIGSRFLIEGEWWSVTSRPEMNFLYLESDAGECRVIRIEDLLGIDGIAPPPSAKSEPQEGEP